MLVRLGIMVPICHSKEQIASPLHGASLVCADGLVMNQLYYGDNLEVLRQHIKDESIDLVYLDPLFNSHQDYNILFADLRSKMARSQPLESTHLRIPGGGTK